MKYYTYTITWDKDEEEYCGTCTELPSLSYFDHTHVAALNGIIDLVFNCVQEYISFINNIDIDGEITDDVLHRVCVEGISIFNVSDETIAHRFDMSRSSVNRWKNGRNLPHPAMRKHIVEFFKEISKTRK